jgi:hypothetical protein
MPEQPEQDPTLRLAEEYILAFADALARLDTPPRQHRIRLQTAGCSITLSVSPVGAGAPSPVGQTECEEACLTLLAQLRGEPISGRRAVKEMERRGIGIFGEATVRRALRRLKQDGEICGCRQGRPGYFLPTALPIVKEIERREQTQQQAG